MRVTDRHINEYRQQGFAVVERFLTAEEVADALVGFYRIFPTYEEFQAGKPIALPRDEHVFPWDDSALNRTVTHPELVSAAQRIIGTRAVKLACCNLWARYAGKQQDFVEFHTDHGNNTLGPLMPEDHSNITLALVLTDVTPGMAPTLMVPWGQPDAAAVPMTVPAGSLIIYSTNTTRHAASAFTAERGCRPTIWTIWSHKDRAWEGRGWTYKSTGKTREFIRYMTEATPQQLEVIGFPPPGSPLWTHAFILAMAARYPGFNTRPYLDALPRVAQPEALPSR